MFIKRLILFLAAVAVSGIALAQGSSVQVRTTRPDATATAERDFAEGKVLVSVVDAQRAPVLGLTKRDFSVGRAGETAEVINAEPIDRSTDVSRHVVLVLDNSYSMEERRTIPNLLSGVSAMLKTLRPIDDARIVVLKDGKPVKMGERDVHVEVFQSKSPSELEAFATSAYAKKRVTDNTYLYEAIYAGLDILRAMPAGEPRFVMVFSDGEDLNSGFKGDVVAKAAEGVPNVRVLAVDYMPGAKIDDTLAALATKTGGQARKAAAGSDLVAIFQQAATKVEHYYVVTYAFAPPPARAAAVELPPASPKRASFSQSALFDFNKSELKPAGKERLKAYFEKTKEELSVAHSIKITGHTDNVGTPEYNKKLSMRRAEATRDYLVSIGADASKMEVGGEGESQPVADNSTKEGRAKNRRVEIDVTGVGH